MSQRLEPLQSPQLIATDLDGTLVFRHGADRADARALAAWRAGGDLLTLATGRSVGLVRRAVDAVAASTGVTLGYDYVVCASGTTVLDGAGRVLRTRALEPGQVAAVAELVMGRGDTALFASTLDRDLVLHDPTGFGDDPRVYADHFSAATLAQALEVDTKRVQFTPDLMPGDVTGSLVYDARSAEFSFRPGPVFTNLLLADEINRTPPKTQAALLEAMEERQVSVDGEPRPLPDPFMVIATQNPVEYEGTYPLPEAQLDRFLLKLVLPLPERGQEIEILSRHAGGFDPRDLVGAGLSAVASPRDLAAAREQVRTIGASPEVLAYIVDLVRATRSSPSVSLGVSPRGATALLATARAWAWLSGRSFITPDDVKALALPTLRHRIGLRAEAELEGVTTESVITGVLRSVAVPR